MPETQDVLDIFHPLIRRWFRERVGQPTVIQQKAWPVMAGGEHVLLTAPTGSGKTLTAFLWALDRLVSGHWPTGRTGVLYVSPLKALNTDIRLNLLAPLDELGRFFRAEGEPFPEIRVLTRSGDTPQPDRRRMLRFPPEILITTPESLNLLLSSSGVSILGRLRTVILDEIHTVAASKRGVHLITAVDRLVRLSGEFQRIMISATVRPLEKVARLAGGFRMERTEKKVQYLPRKVRIISTDAVKDYDLQVLDPGKPAEPGDGSTVWDRAAERIRPIIHNNRSTLIFTNNRRLSERLTSLLNRDEETPVCYAHHGSLSREIRSDVESRLKNGRLRAIAATNSLELGIDIGSLDEVVLAGSPPSLSSAVQRVGRSGHRVGGVSRGRFFPVHDLDILQSAVLAGSVPRGEIEETRPPEAPLDVLAQVIVSMTGAETWRIDELYDFLRTSAPYRSLSRRFFDLVLDMLAGRYSGTRIRELQPRVFLDRVEGTVSARRGALLQLFLSGGTIPDRGYYHLRLESTGARIGELDEEFVWEAKIGQRFTFGTQNWRIQRITHNDVIVRPSPASGAKAERPADAFVDEPAPIPETPGVDIISSRFSHST